MGITSARPGRTPGFSGSPGLHSEHTAPSSDLRTDTFSGDLEIGGSLTLVQSPGICIKGQAALSGFGLSATAWTDISDVTTVLNKSRLPYPVTPCISIFRTGILTASGEIQFRVSGMDQFGNQQEEVTPNIAIAEPDWLAGNGTDFATARIWLSKVFAKVTRIEARSPTTWLPDDVMAMGYNMLFDRCIGKAVIFTDPTDTGTFQIRVTNTSGGNETTAAIDVTDTAATVKDRLEALTMLANTAIEMADLTAVVNGGPGNPIIIYFPDSVPRDQFDISIVLGTATGPFTVTGEERFGHDNLGIGLPLHTLPTGAALYEIDEADIMTLLLVDNAEDRVVGMKSFVLESWSNASPSVGVLDSDAPGLTAGQNMIAFIEGAAADIDGVRHVEAVDGDTVNVTVTPAPVGGTDGVIWLPVTRNQPVIKVDPMGGTIAAPTAAGYHVGTNATGWQGGRDKFGIYIDSSRNAAAHTIPESLIRFRAPRAVAFKGQFRFQAYIRNTRYTTRRAGTVGYPR